MTLNIFKVDKAPEEFEKQANLAIQLTNPPEEWDQEVMEYVYRLHPWLADFTLSVEFIKKLPDRQYGIGSITVRPKKPLVASSKSRGVSEDLVLAHIPVIIREGTLSPVDIFLSGTSVIPLDEDNFRKRVGSAVDTNSTSANRNDPTLIGHLWPPGRSSFGGPGAELGMSVLNKFSSDEEGGEGAAVDGELKKIAEDEIESLRELEGYPLLGGILRGQLAYSAEKAQKLASLVQGSTYLRPILGSVVSDVLDNLPECKAPRGSVAQLMKTAEGYRLRSADPSNFSFTRGVDFRDVSRNENTEFAVYTSFEPSASALSGEKTAESEETPDLGVAFLHEGSKQRKGVLFRDVIDFDGEKTGQSLFADFDRGAWSLENEFSGLTAGQKLADFDNSPLEGTGVFVTKLASGEFACTVPVTLHRQDVSKAGPLFHATVHSTKLAGEFATDTAVKIYFSPAVTNPVFVAKTASLMLPTGYTWVSVGTDRFRPYSPIDVSSGVVDVTKLASNEYQLSGAPVSAVVPETMNVADTQFTLAALGVDVEQIPAIMKEASVRLHNCNTLIPREEPAVKVPELESDDLVKAAAYLSDPNTVDAVLGLSLLDFEVEDDYMVLAQNLEQAQQKVARLLLLSRLGMYSIPEGASKVVMLRLSPIIDALKVLSMQKAYTN